MNDLHYFKFERPYRCQDCGRVVAFRSRSRTFTERYILPLFFMQPVRCAECFRRDYRSIFTSVHERHESAAPVHRNAA